MSSVSILLLFTSILSHASVPYGSIERSIRQSQILAEILPPVADSRRNERALEEDGWDGYVERFDPRSFNQEASADGGARRAVRSLGNCEQTGIASWYGGGFQGKRTANGERFDTNSLSAAHKSLPMGMWVRVLNLRTGLAVVVRINDDGPHVKGRIIDLSKKAKEAIGMVDLDKVELNCML